MFTLPGLIACSQAGRERLHILCSRGLSVASFSLEVGPALQRHN
jgi:hypothetical protein